MSHEAADLKPLYLSEEEALALLDLCVISQSETTQTHEQAMMKLSNLTRRFLRAESENREVEKARRGPVVFPAAPGAVFA